MSVQHAEYGPCACPACSGQTNANDAQPSTADRAPQMAPTFNDTQVIGQINSGAQWSGAQISYGFLASAPSWDMGYEGNGFSGFTTYQANATRAIMSLWDDLVSPSFVEQTSSQQYANVKFGNTTTSINYAHAYYPGGYDWAGEVWLNAPTYNGLNYPDPGDYYWMTILHEVGHAIGLSHPGSYNGGSPTYANDAEYAQDTHQWSVMSYFSASNTGADWNGGSGWQYAQTPMIHDVLTIQSIYGADTTTRTGDTAYGFNSNAGNAVFDFTQNQTPVLTIYDAGGIDTLDLSGFSQRAIINLEPGTYSSAGGTSSLMTYNIGIAGNTWIENAIGGSGNDTIYGNALGNELSGLGGNDQLYGYGGSDTISGGGGIDWAFFEYAFSSYTFQVLSASIQVIGDFVDTVLNDVEWFLFDGFTASYQDVVSLAAPVTIDTNGDYDLVLVGGQYRIQDDSGTDIGLTKEGGPVGPYNGWSVIQVEENAGDDGFEVLQEKTDGRYRLWHHDETGVYQSSQALSAVDLVNYETTFEVDLDGDDIIGPPGPPVPPPPPGGGTTIETNGDYDLVLVGGQYRIQDDSGTDIGLTKEGGPVGPYNGWSVIQVEENAGDDGFEVLQEKTDGRYRLWHHDETGVYQSSQALSAADLVNYETTFEVDLDGDDIIGPPGPPVPPPPPGGGTTIETNGDYDLVLVGGQYRIQDDSGTDIGLTKEGGPVGPYNGWSVIQVEENAGDDGFEVLQEKTDGRYRLWHHDETGVYQSSQALSAADLVNYETTFEVDLDGDDIIGPPGPPVPPPPPGGGTTIETNGDYDLVLVGGQYRIQDDSGTDIGLTKEGGPVAPYNGWSVIQVEENAGDDGFEVLQEKTDGRYRLWHHDETGVYQSSEALSAADLVNYETTFEVDLDGNGSIATVVTTDFII